MMINNTIWDITSEEQLKYESIFTSLNPINNKLAGDQCKSVFLNSQLHNACLVKIWDLADIDKDGCLDRYEMYVALHLIYKSLQGIPIPESLPLTLVPPTKRDTNIRRQSFVGSSDFSFEQEKDFHRRTSSFSQTSNKFGSSTSLPPSVCCRSGSEFVLDISKFESQFSSLDTDSDGLLGGDDVRDVLMASGLSQQILAHIWALVDINKLGCLNIEQFSICMELISQHKQGAIDVLSEFPNELPATIRPRCRQRSSTASIGIPGASVMPTENPKVTHLVAEINSMTSKRRHTEQVLFQIEADTTIKNSEIKNLEIELLSLNSTCKQLKSQRIEAAKRLNELDVKIDKLNESFLEQEQRTDESYDKLTKKKQEIQNAKDNFELHGTMIDDLFKQSNEKNNKLMSAKSDLDDKLGLFNKLMDDLAKYERQTELNNSNSIQLTAKIAEAKEILIDGLQVQLFPFKI